MLRVALLFVALSCLGAIASAQEPPCNSVWDILTSSRQTTLCRDILKERELDEALMDPALEATVFCPINAAWLDPSLYTALEEWPVFGGAQLTAEALILRYPDVTDYILENHIVGQNVETAELMLQPRLRTLNGNEYLSVRVLESNTTTLDASCDDKLVTVESSLADATLLFCGLSACGKSTVYLVDMVLLPEAPPSTPETQPTGQRRRMAEVGCTSAYGFLSTSNDHSFFKDMVDAAGMADQLDDPSWEGTLFAPPNAALSSIITELGVGLTDFLSHKQLLRDWVLYHMVDGAPLPTSAWQQGGALASSTSDDKLMLLPLAEHLGSAATCVPLALFDSFSKRDVGVAVTTCDIRTCKALVHGVDDMLISERIEAALPSAFPHHEPARFHDAAYDDWTFGASLTSLNLEELVQ